MKFNVGDHVRIKLWDELVEEFGTDSDGDINMPIVPMLSGSMARYLCGLEFKVQERWKYNFCYTSDDRSLIVDNWYIGEDALELITDEPKPDELLDFLKGYART